MIFTYMMFSDFGLSKFIGKCCRMDGEVEERPSGRQHQLPSMMTVNTIVAVASSTESAIDLLDSSADLSRCLRSEISWHSLHP